MTNPADSSVQNLLPVQAYFNANGSFNTFIGQGQPFYATANPSQSGLTITNSTLNSSPIGNTSPSTGVFTNISTTTGTISTQPTGATDIVNLLALQSYAAGISWKQPCAVATLANITLSGLQTIDGYTTLAGDRVLVKNQSNAANNGIYLASATAWTRSLDANEWQEFVSAITFIEYGTQAGGAWFCTATPGGTLGVTALNWSQFTTSATYSAGTGLTLTGSVFSITPVGTASTYGSATQTPVFTTNASGQVSSVTNTTITPAIGSITGLGTGVATALAVNTGSAGAFVVNGGALGTPSSGTLTNCTFPTLNQNTTGYAASLAGGAAGSVPYQTASNTTGFLAAGSNGQVLTLASGIPSWATPTTGTVTSVGGTGTVSGISLSGTVTSSGSLTLGGTLDLSSPPAIGGTTANTVRGTTVTATSNFVGSYFDASGSGGGALRNSGGTACLQWGGGGGANLTVDVSANLNGANAQIDISPTGTGHVHLNPAGSGSVEIKPTSAGVMDNMVIGGTTPLAGTFTNLRVNGTISLAGSTGTAGYVITSNGASAPTWQVLPATGLGIVDDTTTNATRYLAFTSATSGNITTQNVSSTKLQYNPSTGTLTSTNLAYTGTLTGGTGIVNLGSGQFYKDASGNVGIGIASPNYKLQAVNTSAGAITTQLFLQNNDATDGTGARLDFSAFNDGITATGSITNVRDSGGSYSVRFSTFGSSANTERMRIDSSGNVGIGTASPSQKLSVAGLISATGRTLATGFFNTTNVTGVIVDASSADYYVNNAFAMRIDSSGNLLVGTTTAQAKFHVEAGSDEAVYAKNTAGAASATMVSWNNAGTGNNYLHAFFVDAGGSNVGNIDYNRAAGLLRYNVTSDATLKNIIGDSNGQRSLEILNTTRIRDFAWKNDTEQKTQIGVIAQELYETYKGAVSVGGENDKGEYRPWGVDKTAFTFHLIAGWQEHEKLIQEQQALITDLTTRLTALENK